MQVCLGFYLIQYVPLNLSRTPSHFLIHAAAYCFSAMPNNRSFNSCGYSICRSIILSSDSSSILSSFLSKLEHSIALTSLQPRESRDTPNTLPILTLTTLPVLTLSSSPEIIYHFGIPWECRVNNINTLLCSSIFKQSRTSLLFRLRTTSQTRMH